MIDAQDWNAKQQKALAEASKGLSVRVCARRAGVVPDTVTRWKRDIPGFKDQFEGAQAAAWAESVVPTAQDMLILNNEMAVERQLDGEQARPCDLDNAHKVLAQLDPTRWREVKNINATLNTSPLAAMSDEEVDEGCVGARKAEEARGS